MNIKESSSPSSYLKHVTYVANKCSWNRNSRDPLTREVLDLQKLTKIKMNLIEEL